MVSGETRGDLQVGFTMQGEAAGLRDQDEIAARE
jgi:hypothetical protein